MSTKAFHAFLSEARRNHALAFGLTDILCEMDGQELHTAIAIYARNLGYDVNQSDVSCFHQRLQILIGHEGELPDDWLDEITGGVVLGGQSLAMFGAIKGIFGFACEMTGRTSFLQPEWKLKEI